MKESLADVPEPCRNRFHGIGIWAVVSVTLVPVVCVAVFLVSITAPTAIDGRLGLASLAFGWGFFSLAVSIMTAKQGLDARTFILLLLFFPLLLPFVILLIPWAITLRRGDRVLPHDENARG
ncbi:hypothetical protein [Rosistilla oblonga]|uniref:hypothetical protein n=1 Tax=Rosistilla oblonga TaxID=2527990 RepID=UPI003A96A13F